jgi:glucokinase
MSLNNTGLSYQSEAAIIVGDIGGTFIRLALAFFNEGQWALEGVARYATSHYSCLSEAVVKYKEKFPDLHLQRGCFAVAGPVANQEHVQLTNIPWVLDATAVASKSGLDQVHLMNDFAAFAYAIPWLESDQKVSLKKGSMHEHSPVTALGPGTGLGFALYLPSFNHVIPCEGGHQALVGNTKAQCAILATIGQDQGFVSIEHLLSGQGLPLLYKHWALWHEEDQRYHNTKEVSQAALAGCAHAQSFVLFFVEWLLAVIADTVLAQGARSVMIGGGLVPRWVELIQNNLQLEQHFYCRPQMLTYLESVSIDVCMDQNAALMGAASYLQQLNQRST